MIFHRMFPVAADRTIVECDWLYLPEVVASGKDVAASVELFHRVNEQDFDACERCQLAAGSRVTPRAACSCPASTTSDSSTSGSPGSSTPLSRSERTPDESVDVLRGADPVLCSSLADADPEVFAAISAELARQESTLEMIASENFAPLAVMQAQGSVMTNKYAEGYPGVGTTAAASTWMRPSDWRSTA